NCSRPSSTNGRRRTSASRSRRLAPPARLRRSAGSIRGSRYLKPDRQTANRSPKTMRTKVKLTSRSKRPPAMPPRADQRRNQPHRRPEQPPTHPPSPSPPLNTPKARLQVHYGSGSRVLLKSRSGSIADRQSGIRNLEFGIRDHGPAEAGHDGKRAAKPITHSS